ncbi:uncharacterized protein I206_104181 [Kwoniella pini CBS 10737]|uniref:Uncharacterized protein n=1 Tax=Kwoniella pini CBS 10737 TaxID=1296096 RepID=A0A1B9I2E3_9TREE|nr:uncharacterized protein I206_04244 [Kwoniella pini CBS 10737]OCF49720.1 hypothetical protein I206_04244 [Kwoniella pini CBS 10737]
MADLPAQLRPTPPQSQSLSPTVVLSEINPNVKDSNSNNYYDSKSRKGSLFSTMGTGEKSNHPQLPPIVTHPIKRRHANLELDTDNHQAESSILTSHAVEESAPHLQSGSSNSETIQTYFVPPLYHPLPKGPPCNTPEVIGKAIKRQKRDSLNSTPNSTISDSVKAGIAGRGLTIREHRNSLDVVVKGEKSNLEWPWEDDDDDDEDIQDDKELTKEERRRRRREEKKCLTSAPISVSKKNENQVSEQKFPRKELETSIADRLSKTATNNKRSSSAPTLKMKASDQKVDKESFATTWGGKPLRWKEFSINKQLDLGRKPLIQTTLQVQKHSGATKSSSHIPTSDNQDKIPGRAAGPNTIDSQNLQSTEPVKTPLTSMGMTAGASAVLPQLADSVATNQHPLQTSMLNQPVPGLTIPIMQRLPPSGDNSSPDTLHRAFPPNTILMESAKKTPNMAHPTVQPFAVNSGPVTLNMLLSHPGPNQVNGLPLMSTLTATTQSNLQPTPLQQQIRLVPGQITTASALQEHKTTVEPVILRRLAQAKEIIDSLQYQLRTAEINRDWYYGTLYWTNVVADKLVAHTSYSFIASTMAKLCGRYLEQESIPLEQLHSPLPPDSIHSLLIDLAVSVDCMPPNINNLQTCPIMESIFYRVIRILMRDYDSLTTIEIHSNDKNQIVVPGISAKDPIHFLRPPDILWVFVHVGEPRFYTPLVNAVRTSLWACPTTRRGIALLLLLGRLQGSRMTLGIENKVWARNLGLILENNHSQLPDTINENATLNTISQFTLNRVEEPEIELALRYVKSVRDQEKAKKDAMMTEYQVEQKGGRGGTGAGVGVKKRMSEGSNKKEEEEEEEEEGKGKGQRRGKRRKTSHV